MQAPHIPNLNTIRTGRGGHRRRGRGVPSAPLRDPSVLDETTVQQQETAQDEIVQGTDTDASIARKSAVDAGYLADPYANFFCFGEPGRRLPLMNRGISRRFISDTNANPLEGTYLRTQAIDLLVNSFLEASRPTPKQIISLGAGSDTRFFRIREQHPGIKLVYHELDFPQNTQPKIRAISSPKFKERTARFFGHDEVKVSADATRLSSPPYHIHPIDLRQLIASDPQEGTSELHDHIEREWPTLIISECCLVYLSDEEAEKVILHLNALLKPASSVGLIIYEPTRPNDGFGRTMVENLTARGVHLKTLEAFPTPESQRDRFKKYGYSGMQWASDMDWIWRKWIPEDEKQRVQHLEFMDEMEEWQLFLTHYCVAWGSTENLKTDEPESSEGAFHRWLQIPTLPEQK